MEELVLTVPVVAPQKITAKYHVVAITLDLEAVVGTAGVPGLVLIALKSDLGVPLVHTYTGALAVTLIRQLNTANLSIKSLHKRVLERLATDGVLLGTVSGTPD